MYISFNIEMNAIVLPSFHSSPNNRFNGINRIRFTRDTQNKHSLEKSFAAGQGSPSAASSVVSKLEKATFSRV